MATPKEKNILQVRMPNMRNGTLAMLREEIIGAIKSAKEGAENHRHASDLVVLFSENALEYRFNIEGADVRREAKLIQGSLPKEMCVIVAFSAQVHFGKKIVANMGYLITTEAIRTLPKRKIVDSDFCDYREGLKTGAFENWSMLSWDRWATKLKYPKTPFQETPREIPYPRVITPSGNKIEHRVCSDASYDDSYGRWIEKDPNYDPDVITIVSADSLKTKYPAQLKPYRLAVIVNDGESVYMPAHCEEAREKGIGELVQNQASIDFFLMPPLLEK